MITQAFAKNMVHGIRYPLDNYREYYRHCRMVQMGMIDRAGCILIPHVQDNWIKIERHHNHRNNLLSAQAADKYLWIAAKVLAGERGCNCPTMQRMYLGKEL